MPTIFSNFQSGTLTDNPLTSGATSVNSAAFANLPVVASPDTMWLALDPTGVNGAPEIVQVTVHTSSATVLTVVRAQQSTTARAHPVGTQWVASATKAELDELPFRKMTARGDMLAATGVNVAGRLAVGAANTVLTSNGTDPVWGSVTNAMITDLTVGTADIADSAITSVKIADGTIVLGDLAAAVQNLLVPAGAVAMTVAAAAPTGWLFHNQTSVGAQTAFPALWAVAPASWKSGANLVIPDLSNRALMQAGATALGAVGGANSRTIAAGNLPVHQHAIDHDHGAVTSGAGSAHDHGVTDPTHQHGTLLLANPGAGAYSGFDKTSVTASGTTLGAYIDTSTFTAATGISINNESAHTHSVDLPNFTGNSGNGGFANTALDTTPAHAAFNVMIKAH